MAKASMNLRIPAAIAIAGEVRELTRKFPAPGISG